MLQIPENWEDVTPLWMTEAISAHHPGSRVSAVSVIMIDNGTNRRARLRLTYSEGAGPEVVFVKAEGDHRAVHALNGNLFNEPELFASGVPLPVDHPLPYKVVIDEPALDYVIVMEDVTNRGADPRDATRPMTVDQVANGVRGLARLHSRYWGLTALTHPALGWMQTWAPTEGFLRPLEEHVPAGLARGAGRLPEELTMYDAETIVASSARFLGSLTPGPVTLLHADPHIGNTYVLPNDDVGFLDWQCARRGNWSHDVGYFVMSALPIEARRAHEAALLEEYLDILDVPDHERPTFQEAWLRYRASAAYGLAVWLATLSGDTAQSREVSLTLCERYATAFLDLATPDALASLSRG